MLTANIRLMSMVLLLQATLAVCGAAEPYDTIPVVVVKGDCLIKICQEKSRRSESLARNRAT